MELSYSQWNAEQNPAQAERLVLLHGMGGTGMLWRPIAASLEKTISILAPDQRGHGKSQIQSVPGGIPQPDYTPLAYGRDVIDTMEATGFHPAWLVGHSMGVRTACAAAHLRPDWVRGLVLIDLGFSGQAGGGLGDNLGNFLKLLPHEFETRNQAREFMTQHCPDPSIAQYLMAVSVRIPPTETTPEKITFPFDHAALIQTIQAARDASVRQWVKALAQNRMPVLVLRGAKSLVWSREDFLNEKAQLASFPSVRFEEIEGAGHGLPFEKRPEFIALLERFISDRR
jgi:pimeloyl-ACP methyl ester carboxylesterase